MEKYKSHLRLRRNILVCFALLAAATGLFDVFFAPEAVRDSAVFEFQLGLIHGAGILSLLWAVRDTRSLRSKAALRLAYNRENDERMKAIRARAGMPMLLISSAIILLAAMVAGCFSAAVFYTLVAVAAGQLTLGAAVKFFYMKKL